MMFNILNSIFLTAVGIVLFFASVDDLRYRIISKLQVVLMFLFAIIIAISTLSIENTTVSMTFIFCLIVFYIFAVVSRGGFGMGDVFCLSALIWVVDSIGSLPHFLLLLSIVSLCWACYWILWIFRKNGYKHLYKSFKQTRIVPVEELQPKMVLASDNFMMGLKPEDILKIKEEGYYDEIEIKEPLPFVPCLFVAYLLFFIL